MREFAIKNTWRGLVVMVRYKVPANGYGDFEWSRWKRAGLDEYKEVMQRMTGQLQHG